MIERNLELLFYWMNERHNIYLRRKREPDRPPPWTDDEILQTYKFTNVFRQLDRTTRELNKRLNVKPVTDFPPQDRLYKVILFRAFNKTETYDLIHQNHVDEQFSKMKKLLHRHASEGGKVFTGAYIITNGGQNRSKIDLMVEALEYIHAHRLNLWFAINDAKTLKDTTKFVAEYPMQGPFTAYEVACDLRYQKKLIKFRDTMTWANPGPGALRGLRRILCGYPKRSDYSISKSDAVELMQWLLQIATDDGRWEHEEKLEMREIEHSLCEFDKYCRALYGEGRPRGKYRWKPKV